LEGNNRKSIFVHFGTKVKIRNTSKALLNSYHVSFFSNTPPGANGLPNISSKQGKNPLPCTFSSLENVSSYFNSIKFELHSHVNLWHEDRIPRDSKSKNDFAKIVLGESEPMRSITIEPFAI
jgi:hypothetical protein